MARPATGSVLFEGGRWKARLTMPDGSREVFPLPEWYGEAEARSKAREMAEAVKRYGVEWRTCVEIPADEDVDGWFKRYVAALEAKGRGTRDVESHYRNHIGPLLGPVNVRLVKREHVEAVRDALDRKIREGYVDAEGASHKPLSWKTAWNAWGTLSKLFDEAMSSKDRSLKVRDDDPTDRVKGPDRGDTKELQYLYPSEFLRLVSCDRVPLHWRRLYALAFFLGLRAGEIEALEWIDVDFVAGIIRIRRGIDREHGTVKGPKTQAGRRKVPIEANLLPLLAVMHAEAIEAAYEADKRDGETFDRWRARAREQRPDLGRVMKYMPGVSELAWRTRQYLRWAGVDRPGLLENTATTRAFRFHDARASYVTWQSLRGMDAKRIQRRAGHESAGTTDRYLREAEVFGVEIGEPFPPLPVALLRATTLAGVPTEVSAGGFGRQKDEAPESRGDSGAFVVTPTGLEPVLLA